MKLKIEMSLNNAAFGENMYSAAGEVNLILTHFSRRMIRDGLVPGFKWDLIDTNGNTVGSAVVEEE